MLTLSRYPRPDKDTILIGDIQVIVKAVRGDRVVLGVEAPQETRIVRGELTRYGRLAQPEGENEERSDAA